MRKAQFFPKLLHAGEQLGLAVEAALRVVTLVVGVVEFFRLQNARGNTQLGGEGERRSQFAARQGSGVGDHRQHLWPERALRGKGQERGVRAARVRDQQRPGCFQGGVQLRGFVSQTHSVHCRRGQRANG